MVCLACPRPAACVNLLHMANPCLSHGEPLRCQPLDGERPMLHARRSLSPMHLRRHLRCSVCSEQSVNPHDAVPSSQAACECQRGIVQDPRNVPWLRNIRGKPSPPSPPKNVGGPRASRNHICAKMTDAMLPLWPALQATPEEQLPELAKQVTEAGAKVKALKDAKVLASHFLRWEPSGSPDG